MSEHDQLAQLIKNDPQRWELLAHVRTLELPDCWVGAGFVRNAVWAHLHQQPLTLDGDVDVIWHGHNLAQTDRMHEVRLSRVAPSIKWSVKNQTEMHIRNGDAPYTSVEDAMRYWPETATAVAVRRSSDDECDVLAPLGLSDLFGLILKPAGDFVDRKKSIFDERVRTKQWLQKYPDLKLCE